MNIALTIALVATTMLLLSGLDAVVWPNYMTRGKVRIMVVWGIIALIFTTWWLLKK